MRVTRRGETILLGMMVGMLAVADATLAAERKREVIAEITDVKCVVLEREPPSLVVTATGKIHRRGYTKESLDRVVYTRPPADGIQDYFLTAVPPEVGPALEGTITAKDQWDDYTREAPWLKGVRIHGASDGGVIKMLKKDEDPPGDAPGQKFTGESKDGNFQEALDAAIAEAQKELSQGGADIGISWTLHSTTGVSGTIAGLRTVTVTISAHRK